MGDLAVLEQSLGYAFRDRELLVRALTHKSSVYEKNPASIALSDNEQLEFLGDSILGFVISEHLMRRFPTLPEGRLSKFKAHLVSSTHLYGVAQRLELGDQLILGRGEEMSGGRLKRALLADAFEAIIAAVYLDGGLEASRVFVERFVPMDPGDDGSNEITLADYKSALQEKAQAMRLPQPRYSIITEDGPEHAKMFTVEVRVGTVQSRAQGSSKKAAGQKAAQLVLEQLDYQRAS